MAGLRAAVRRPDSFAHLDSVMAVEGIALNDLGFDAFTPEDVRETFHYGRGSRPDEPVTAMMGCLLDMAGAGTYRFL